MIDYPKGPEIPKSPGMPMKPDMPPQYDVYGRPIKSKQNVDAMGRPVDSFGRPFGGEGRTIDPMVILGSKSAIDLVKRVFFISFLLFAVFLGAVIWLLISFFSGPWEAAERFVISSPEIKAISAEFHSASIDNGNADLVGNYVKDGKTYPIWISLKKTGDEWTVVDYASQPPQGVLEKIGE
jgi:hypothetical protein